MKAVTLDTEFPAPTQIRLMKMDVEGHELSALEGALEQLRSGRLGAVIYEDHELQPSPVTKVFTRHGYKIFKLLKTPSGPLLETLGGPTPALPFEAPNYLAALDADGWLALAAERGWRCLTNGR